MVLGWLLAAAAVRAEAPMDLDSPFLKTALVQEKTGEVTEKVVKKGKRNADLLEFEKEEGGLLVLPRGQVMAVLPRLPQAGAAYLQSDAIRALQILEQAQEKFPQRPEVQASALSEWKVLSANATAEDKVQSAALDQWLQACSRLASDVKPEDLEKMREEGRDFLGKFPGRSQEIERELKGLRELAAIDLTKADSVQYDLGGLGDNFVIGAVLWALLLVPLVFALKGFSDGVRGFREGVPLAGGLRLLIGVAALGFLAAILLGAKEPASGASSAGASASVAARKAAWFSMNVRERWATQNPKKINLPAAEWLHFFDEKVVEGAGADSFPYWHLGKPWIETRDRSVVLHQPLRAKFLTLPVCFVFSAPTSGQTISDLELAGASIGKLPLGASVGGLVWQLIQPAYQPTVEKLGIAQGVRWMVGEGDSITLETPATTKPAPQAKESLAARELAEVFDQGYGYIYKERYVTVQGILDDVVSRREELGLGTSLNQGGDYYDEFYLVGIPERGIEKRIRIRCQIKDQDRVFFLDGRGDLFYNKYKTEWVDIEKKGGEGPKGKKPEKVKSVTLDKEGSLDPLSNTPLFRKGGEVRFTSGRVESEKVEFEAVTLYDCQKFEIRNQGEDWRVVWQASQK